MTPKHQIVQFEQKVEFGDLLDAQTFIVQVITDVEPKEDHSNSFKMNK